MSKVLTQPVQEASLCGNPQGMRDIRRHPLALVALFVLLALPGAVLLSAPSSSRPAPQTKAQQELDPYRQAQARSQALWGALMLSGVLFAGMATLTLAWLVRKSRTPDRKEILAKAQREMDSLLQLAQASEEKARALEAEKAERQRTEQDLHFNQQLLTRALDEKIQLGRDLHDGIIQSLYSAGLTLEAAKAEIRAQPELASQRVDQTVALLNSTIRDVRAFIRGLSPESLRISGFKSALSALAGELSAGAELNFDIRVDEPAAGLLSLEQSRELIQLAREAVSNALRHGKAKTVALYLGRDGGELAFLIRDDGTGFDPEAPRGGGNGLRNMQARVQRLSGRLSIRSTPGQGTIISLFVPVEE